LIGKLVVIPGIITNASRA